MSAPALAARLLDLAEQVRRLGMRTGVEAAAIGRAERDGVMGVDGSALAALAFGAAEAIAAGGGRLVAPSLLGFELANMFLIRMRRAPARLAAPRAAARLVERLAAATGLTAYDASYRWLVRAWGELVTLDRKLAAAV